MSNIAVLAQKPVNHEIVAALEELLADAKAGDVVSLVFTAERVGNEFESFANFKDGLLLLGHLARQTFAINCGIGK